MDFVAFLPDRVHDVAAWSGIFASKPSLGTPFGECKTVAHPAPSECRTAASHTPTDVPPCGAW